MHSYLVSFTDLEPHTISAGISYVGLDSASADVEKVNEEEEK